MDQVDRIIMQGSVPIDGTIRKGIEAMQQRSSNSRDGEDWQEWVEHQRKVWAGEVKSIEWVCHGQ